MQIVADGLRHARDARLSRIILYQVCMLPTKVLWTGRKRDRQVAENRTESRPEVAIRSLPSIIADRAV